MRRLARLSICLIACLTLTACGARFGFSGNQSGAQDAGQSTEGGQFAGTTTGDNRALPPGHPQLLEGGRSIWSLFTRERSENTVLVNRYIWAASLEVLDFLPVQNIDPFTGVIVTGYGTPPNGGRSYRATVLIDDPALDARSLKVALQSRGGGTVNPATVRAIEDAILTRARQLRVADSRI